MVKKLKNIKLKNMDFKNDNLNKNYEHFNTFFSYIQSPKLKRFRFLFTFFLIFPVPWTIAILWLVCHWEPKWLDALFWILPFLTMTILFWIFKSLYEKFNTRQKEENAKQNTTINLENSGDENTDKEIKDANIIEDETKH